MAREGRIPADHRLNILSRTPSEGEAPPFAILDWPTGGTRRDSALFDPEAEEWCHCRREGQRLALTAIIRP